MPNLDDIIEGRIRLGNTNYELEEIAYGQSLEVIWPVSITYAIVTSSIVIHYSEDKNGNAATMITADGYNYAYATANVQVFRNGVLYQTLQNQRLTPVSLKTFYGEPTERFFTATVDGLPVIRAYHLHQWDIRSNEECVVEWGFGDAPTVTPQGKSVYQEANEADERATTQSIFASYDGNSIITSLDMTSAGQSRIPLYIYANVYFTGTYKSGDPIEPYYSVVAISSPSGSVDPGPTVSVNAFDQAPSAVIDEWSGYYLVSFPENTSSTKNNRYDIDINYNGHYTYLTATVAAVQEATYTFDQLSVTQYYYQGGNVIPASGGSKIPYVAFQLRYKRNGVVQGTLYGVVNNGEVSGVATDQYDTYSTEVTLEYDGTGIDIAGVANAVSKGTNPSGQTTVASGLRVRIRKGNSTSSYRNASDSQRVLQQANSSTVKTPGSFNVTSLYFETSPANLTSCKSTQVTVTMRASGSGVTDLLEWTSGAQSGGEQTSLNNDIVTPATISVTNATIANGKFTAVNTHSLNPKTYTITGTYEGTSATAKSITQAADRKVPSSGTYSTTLEAVSGGNSIWAGGGEVLLVAQAKCVSGLVWESDGAAISGESTTTWFENDISLQQASGSSGVKSIAEVSIDTTNHTKTFRVTHRDMAKNETTDTIKVYAKNGSYANSSVWSHSVTNQKTNDMISATEWGNFTPSGQTRTDTRNYLVSLSSSRFTTSSDAAPFVAGAYSILGFSASHEESEVILGTESRVCTYKYSSWYEGSTNYYTQTETRSAEQPSGVWNTVQDTPTIASSNTSVAWLDGSDKRIVNFAAHSGNSERTVTFTATNGGSTANVTLRQSRFMSLTVDPNEALIFEAEAGTLRFNVISKNTKWRITKDGDWMTVSPTSGGSSSQQDTTQVSVTVPANTDTVARIGEIDIVQNDTPALLDAATLDVMQISSEPTASYIAFANAGWISASSIMFELSIKNKLSTKSFSGIKIAVVSTASPNADPSGGQQERLETLSGTFTVPGGETKTFDPMYINNLNRVDGKTYWIKVEHVDLTSSYEQIEESPIGE